MEGISKYPKKIKMDTSYFVELETDRLKLRRLIKLDWPTISYLRSDKEVNKFVKRPNAETKEQAIAFILKTNASIEMQKLLYWAITLNTCNDMIGSICLWNFSDDKKTAEVGYDLHPKFQNKGIMTESLQSVLRFGFKKLKLDIIEAYTQKDNEFSKKLLERNGFTLVLNQIDKENLKNNVYKISAT